MIRLTEWLREASVQDDQHSLIQRCNVAANHIDRLSAERNEEKAILAELSLHLEQVHREFSEETLFHFIRRKYFS
jgi:hypothetical protein